MFSPGPSTKSTQSRIQIPPETREQLQSLLHPSDNNAYIRGFLAVVWRSVNDTLEQDPQLSKRLADFSSFIDTVICKGEKQIFELLRKMVEKESWEELLENDIFYKQVQSSADVYYKEQGRLSPGAIYEQDYLLSKASKTVECAWNTDFKGNAADLLLAIISDYLNKDMKIYEKHTSIVNSSGTGKSRMVDQMAKEIITVPLCLREDGSTGFPPPDISMRNWLCLVGSTDQVHAAKKLHAFMYSLLTVLHKHLSEIEKGIPPPTKEGVCGVIERQKYLALAFRTQMSEGQSLKGSNDYRQSFYKEVFDEIYDFIESEGQAPTPKSPLRFAPDNKAIKEAGRDLCKFIDRGDLLDSNKGPRRPLIVLAFDEAHILTDIPKNRSWTVFSELCRTLQGLVHLPIFSLFISTAGRFHLAHPSSRFSSDLKPLNPITEISFDDITLPAKEGQVTLDRVVQMDWISHLGRPLFGSYYDYLEDRRELLCFAKNKLLCGPSTLNPIINAPGTLACLSVRFALDFNADEISCCVARTQVECHMRLCIAATARSDQLITLAGSEPLLAEAAYELMHPTSAQQANPVQYLAAHQDLSCINRGRRGELVAALIIMQARDMALTTERWVSVSQFMQALLPVPAYNNLSNSTPRFWRSGENCSFGETFKHHSMWFNHTIRIEADQMINAKYLWRFITRGAMIVCTHCQYGVDIVLPVVCDMTKPLSRDNVTAILIQVKADKQFDLDITEIFFDSMNPFTLGLFSEGQSPKPVIRAVFTLASDKDGVVFPSAHECSDLPDDFTAFDIWCAGLSSKTFGQIGDQDLDPYQFLLEHSLARDEFNFDDPFLLHDTKFMRVRRRRRMVEPTMPDTA